MRPKKLGTGGRPFKDLARPPMRNMHHDGDVRGAKRVT